MKYYEMLCVLPGTLSEDEAKTIVNKVQETLDKQGATEIKIYEIGKSRLAYPIKNIRYGYFRLAYFQAEPAVAKELETKLKLISGILRIVTRITKPGADVAEKQVILSSQLDSVLRDSQKEESFERGFESVQNQNVEPEKIEKTVVEKVDSVPEKPTEAIEKIKEEKVEEKLEVVKEEIKEEIKKVEEVKKPVSKQAITLDDIDAKLDEILQQDLDKV